MLVACRCHRRIVRLGWRAQVVDIFLPIIKHGMYCLRSLAFSPKLIDFVGGRDSAYRVVKVDDGYVLVGPASADFGLAKITRDGDVVYKVQTDFGLNRTDIALAAAVQDDGKIIVGGTSQFGIPPNNNLLFSLARYKEDGTLDESFGTNGLVTTDVDTIGGNDEIFDIALDRYQRIVAVGFANSINQVGNAGVFRFGVVRYLQDGSLDQTFGNNGIVLTSFGPDTDSRPRAVMIDSKHRILVAGKTRPISTDPNLYAFAIARYLENGELDTSFGTNGLVIDKISSAQDEVLKLLPFGNKFYAIGISGLGFTVVRYKKNGARDTSFGDNGVMHTSPQDTLYGAFLGELGLSVYLVGRTIEPGQQPKPLVVKMLHNGSIDPIFGRKVVELPEDVQSGFFRDGVSDCLSVVLVGEATKTGSTTADFLVTKIPIV